MDPSCLQYCMTDAQRDHFEQQGYLIVEDALDDDMLGRLLEAGDRVDAEERAARGLAPNALLSTVMYPRSTTGPPQSSAMSSHQGQSRPWCSSARKFGALAHTCAEATVPTGVQMLCGASVSPARERFKTAGRASKIIHTCSNLFAPYPVKQSPFPLHLHVGSRRDSELVAVLYLNHPFINARTTRIALHQDAIYLLGHGLKIGQRGR